MGRLVSGRFTTAKTEGRCWLSHLRSHTQPDRCRSEGEERGTRGVATLDNLLKANTDDVFIKLLMARAYEGLKEMDRAEGLMKEVASYGLGSVPASIARRYVKRKGGSGGATTDGARSPT